MQWSDITTALGDLLQIPITDAASQTPSSNTDFNNILPWITLSAEQRIYREIDFLATRIVDSTVSLSTTSRQATLPSEIIVLQSANVITPSSADTTPYVTEDESATYINEQGDTLETESSALPTPVTGTRVPLLIVSKEFIDQIWPQESVGKAVPQYLAQLNATTVIVAPTADQAYELEVTGILRPSPISAANPSTYISLIYPDLMIYACMIFATGYQRDFGSQSDDPKMAQSWENMYQLAKQSVMDEEQRRKSQSTNWSPFSQTPLSAPRP